jgi:hypothetical protein
MATGYEPAKAYQVCTGLFYCVGIGGVYSLVRIGMGSARRSSLAGRASHGFAVAVGPAAQRFPGRGVHASIRGALCVTHELYTRDARLWRVSSAPHENASAKREQSQRRDVPSFPIAHERPQPNRFCKPRQRFRCWLMD